MNGPQSHRDTEINFLTQRIIGRAIEVHRVLGPGLLEPTYEAALCIELDDAGIGYVRQARLPASYKGRRLGEYRIDLIVAALVIVEVKAVERPNPALRSSTPHVSSNDGKAGRTADQLQLALAQGRGEATDTVMPRRTGREAGADWVNGQKHKQRDSKLFVFLAVHPVRGDRLRRSPVRRGYCG